VNLNIQKSFEIASFLCLRLRKLPDSKGYFKLEKNELTLIEEEEVDTG
jgi:hypothetical protein